MLRKQEIYINFENVCKFEVVVITTDSKIKHLLKLVDDESPEIQKILRDSILNNSINMIFNKSLYETELDFLQVEFFNQLLIDYHSKLIRKAFEDLISSSLEDIDLEKSTLLLAYWNDPSINLKEIQEELNQIALEIEQLIPDTGRPLSFIDQISEYLFREKGLRGNDDDYYNPDNSYIDRVLKNKVGIPISLSIIYILISHRINLPIFGIPLPNHFILKYDDGVDEIFFDPFYGGKIYSRLECLKYLKRAKTRIRNCSTLQRSTNG